MAALHLTPSLPLISSKQTNLLKFHPNPPQLKPHCTPITRIAHRRRRLSTSVDAYKVVVEYDDKTVELEVEDDETILSKALEEDLPVPYDCNLGVCMTCPAKLVSGQVDQSEGMLSDDVIERGYALMCASYPRSDCHIKIIPEDELLSLQLATAND